MNLLLAPHDDDAELFASFLCLKYKPVVLICLDCDVQSNRGFDAITVERRHQESRNGLGELGLRPLFLRVPESTATREKIIAGIQNLSLASIEHVFAPAHHPRGHPNHNAVAEAADFIFGGSIPITWYCTYSSDGKMQGQEVPIEDGEWIRFKLRAIACHYSQMDPLLGCQPHFLDNLREFTCGGVLP